jgi:glucose/arabinose dehydrogenase
MYRVATAGVFLLLLAVCPIAAATPPAAPTITEPSVDGKVLNPADVHMEAGGYSDPDGNARACSDWEIVTAATAEVVWQAPCATGILAGHIHLGDGTFTGSHAGRSELNFETGYRLRVRFRDSAGESGAWAERPFSTSPAGPPGNPSPVPWAVRQPGFEVEVVATGFQLPVNIAFVPDPGPDPGDPFMYVTELYGTVKVVTRDGTVRDYATGLLNFDPTGNFPGSGEQGLTGIAVEPATGDVIVSLLYENTASSSRPHYPKVVRFHSNDGGLTAATQTTILDMFGQDTGASHQVSAVTIGPDGKLYVHNGDGFNTEASQSIDTFRGKVLRMNMDGTAATQNPYYDAANGETARDYLFAYGFRNPFGGAWRAADASLYEVENGPSVDRFAKVVRGRNYLWDGTDASMRNYALFNWEPSHAPVNIAFVQPQTFFGSGFPATHMDRAFVTESGPTYAGGPQAGGKRIGEFAPGTNGDFAGTYRVPLVEYTGTGKATAAGLAAGPDGLYFTDLYKDQGTSAIDRGANVLRVRYVQQPAGYPHPASAAQLRTSLVPAYGPCTAPTHQHGPPLASPSCGPPARESDDLSIGPAFNGSLRVHALPGDPATSADEADVRLRVQLADVRQAGGSSDYAGELEASIGLRLTDTSNGPALNLPATVQDLAFTFAVPCEATTGIPATGATCGLGTTADALAPGMVLDRKRAIWQLDQVDVFDGGPDGDASTHPNARFATQGVFVP